MSKQMAEWPETREDAARILRGLLASVDAIGIDGDRYNGINQSINILAPEPRTEPPGVEGTVYRISNDYMQDIGIVTIETGLLAADVLKVGDSCTITSALPMPKGTL